MPRAETCIGSSHSHGVYVSLSPSIHHHSFNIEASPKWKASIRAVSLFIRVSHIINYTVIMISMWHPLNTNARLVACTIYSPDDRHVMGSLYPPTTVSSSMHAIGNRLCIDVLQSSRSLVDVLGYV
jgi:hypothetical protein